MRLSARKVIKGKVVEVTLGATTAQPGTENARRRGILPRHPGHPS